MDDYISRKTVIDFFNQVIKTHTIGRSRQIVARAFENAKVVFEAIEPADVRPVVLCRDCKHSYRGIEDEPLRCPKTPTELDEDGIGICAPVPDDFWCKYGEPKDSSADMRPEQRKEDSDV